jgi:hypothetical protein
MYRGSTQLALIPDVQLNGDVWLPQKDFFPKAKIPPWIPVSANDSVGDYARRFARAWLNANDLDWQRPMFLAGFEIGGPIAIEAAQWLVELGVPVGGVLLIGSFRDGRLLSRKCRWQGRIMGAFGDQSLRNRLSRLMIRSLITESVDAASANRTAANLATMDASLFRWSRGAGKRWRLADIGPNPKFSIHQIHGRGDRFIRPPSIDEATIILQGQHYITLTHGEQVNRWIEAILRDFDLRRKNADRG